jgi:hypothetical protein
MCRRLRPTVNWLFGTVPTPIVTLQMAAGSFVDGHYLPVGQDAS